MEESQPDFSKGHWLLKIIQKVYCEASCIEGEKSWKEYMFPHIVKCNFHLKKNPLTLFVKQLTNMASLIPERFQL